MEVFLVRHADWENMYNCSGIDIDSVPFAQRQYLVAGIAILVLCSVYFTLYLPCMFSIWKQSAKGNSNYKLLFYIGLADIGMLPFLGFMHSWLSIGGVQFCEYPQLLYVSGTVITGLWGAESTSDMVLAFSRCLGTLSPEAAKALFEGWRVHVWMALCTLYALEALLFQPPFVFNPVLFCWIPDPFIGYRPDSHMYVNLVNDIFEMVVAFGSPALYLTFGVSMCAKRLKMGGSSTSMSSLEKAAFLQVFLISLLNTLTCSVAVYARYVNAFSCAVAEFAWFHIHGLPPVIYLALNSEIRLDCKHFAWKLFCPEKLTKVNGVTVVVKPAVQPQPQVPQQPQPTTADAPEQEVNA